ncbi:hypothetical protein PSN_3203 [Pseudomonas sp. NGC7]
MNVKWPFSIRLIDVITGFSWDTAAELHDFCSLPPRFFSRMGSYDHSPP